VRRLDTLAARAIGQDKIYLASRIEQLSALVNAAEIEAAAAARDFAVADPEDMGFAAQIRTSRLFYRRTEG